MTPETPSNDIRIATQSRGLYAGFNVWVAAVPKIVILALITWVAVSPSDAGQQLLNLQTWSTASFGSWYIYDGLLHADHLFDIGFVAANRPSPCWVSPVTHQSFHSSAGYP